MQVTADFRHMLLNVGTFQLNDDMVVTKAAATVDIEEAMRPPRS